MTKKDERPTIDPGSNLNPLKKEIERAYAKITAHKKDRGSSNSNIDALLTTLEAKGIGKRPMRMAMAYVEMSEDERKGFDLAYHVAREALGAPLQASLFDGA